MDDRWWTIGVDRDDAPLRYYLYDRDAGTLGLLFSTLSALEGTVLSPMRPLKIKARDGLELVCYCSLPLDADSDGDGIPDAPLPLVLLPHGGPWWRDSWGFRDEHQWLSNRGYAVLSVNFRGSTGFGKDFVNAGNREWGGKILEDQLDAVDWSSRPAYRPKRLAVLGTSFGGYSALALLSIHPEVFRCGVDVSGRPTSRPCLPPFGVLETDLRGHGPEGGRSAHG
jgi:dipeptidyl aminopeptidase/acylaminoacyl peptidase